MDPGGSFPKTCLSSHPHRRLNSLTGQWILVSPHRTKRPWGGQREQTSDEDIPAYDSACYLCPGNSRASGEKNPKYERTFVFPNDYSALIESAPELGQIELERDGADDKTGPTPPPENDPASLLRAAPATGRCLVLSFAPSHQHTFADLSTREITGVVCAWTSLFARHILPNSRLHAAAGSAIESVEAQMAADENELKGAWLDGLDNLRQPARQYRSMLVMENKGAAMGCSNAHPHGQVWVTDIIPEESARELDRLKEHRHKCGRGLLHDYALAELASGERVIFSNESFIAVCPWWASWPFEILIIPRPLRAGLEAGISSLISLSPAMRTDLAAAIRRVAILYDNLFDTRFPYSMGMHQSPLDPTEDELGSSCLHIHFYPPLLRSASVRKFWAGYELLAEPQRDLTPEVAAAKMRECDRELYRTAQARKAG